GCAADLYCRGECEGAARAKLRWIYERGAANGLRRYSSATRLAVTNGSCLPRTKPPSYPPSLGIDAAGPPPPLHPLGAIARGDRDAFARFYDLHATLVHTFALRILRERGEAEEVVQDVFLQVWRQAAAYSTDRGTPEAWLITLTRSRGIDKLRSR